MAFLAFGRWQFCPSAVRLRWSGGFGSHGLPRPLGVPFGFWFVQALATGTAWSTLHRAPVGQGPSGPDWLAISFGFWSGRALATGTAWAGLCLIHHHHLLARWHGVGGVSPSASSFTVPAEDRGYVGFPSNDPHGRPRLSRLHTATTTAWYARYHQSTFHSPLACCAALSLFDFFKPRNNHSPFFLCRNH